MAKWRSELVAEHTLALLLLACSAACSKESETVQRAAPSASTSTTPPAPTPTALVSVTPPPAALTSVERARILGGIGELQAIVRGRATSIVHETETGCRARMDRDGARIQAAQAKVGDRWTNARTRFAGSAPDLGQDVIGIVNDCVLGCLLDDKTDPGHKVGREMVARSCRQAATALDDLAIEVKALP